MHSVKHYSSQRPTKITNASTISTEANFILMYGKHLYASRNICIQSLHLCFITSVVLQDCVCSFIKPHFLISFVCSKS